MKQKMKTNKAAARRFKITATGKIMHRSAGGSHLLTKKSARRKRRYAGLTELSKSEAAKIRRLLAM